MKRYWIDDSDKYGLPVIKYQEVVYQPNWRNPFNNDSKVAGVFNNGEFIRPDLYATKEAADKAYKQFLEHRITILESALRQHEKALKGAQDEHIS